MSNRCLDVVLCMGKLAGGGQWVVGVYTLVWNYEVHLLVCLMGGNERREIAKCDIQHIHHFFRKSLRYDIESSIVAHVHDNEGLGRVYSADVFPDRSIYHARDYQAVEWWKISYHPFR